MRNRMPRSIVRATLAAAVALLATAGIANAVVTAPAQLWTVAGVLLSGSSGDGGLAINARLSLPWGVAATSDGGFLIADRANNRIRRVTPDGVISTVAGTGAPGYNSDGIAATSAQLNAPEAVDPTADGGFLIADSTNNRIRKVSANGTISTVAGTGTPGFNGDGIPAGTAQVNGPSDVEATPDGGFLIADYANHRVRKVSAGGTISTIA